MNFRSFFTNLQNHENPKHFIVTSYHCMLTGCKKNLPEHTLKTTEAVLSSHSTYKIVVEGATTEKFNYQANEPLIASIDENGLSTANKLAETVLTLIKKQIL